MNEETPVASKTLHKDGEAVTYALEDVAGALADGWSREPQPPTSEPESGQGEVEAETVVMTADDTAEVSAEDIIGTEPAEAKDG